LTATAVLTTIAPWIKLGVLWVVDAVRVPGKERSGERERGQQEEDSRKEQ
jgi:hypothetical protein